MEQTTEALSIETFDQNLDNFPKKDIEYKKEIRKFYREDMLNEKNTLSSSSVEVLDKVFKKYSPKDSWSLSILTHGEISWQKSRIGIPEGENGDNAMKLSDIKLDAERIKQRRLMRKQLGLA